MHRIIHSQNKNYEKANNSYMKSIHGFNDYIN